MFRPIRPTSQKVRKAVFDILGDSITGMRILELYCGSGALGLEAMSRGAESAVFVDKDPACIKALKTTLAGISKAGFRDITANTRVIQKDSHTALKMFSRRGLEFDIILMDPPYGKNIPAECLQDMLRCGICSPESYVVVEENSKAEMPGEVREQSCPDMFLLNTMTKKYGDTQVSIYRSHVQSGTQPA